MITAAVSSAEMFELPRAVQRVLDDPDLSAYDRPEPFDTAVRSWLAEHYPHFTPDAARYVVETSWTRHTVRQGRVEATAAELLLIADKLADDDSEAARSLRDKVTAALTRLGVPLPQRPA